MTTPIQDITRGAYTFSVLDDPETRSWNFWDQQYATGVWEPEVLAAIEQILTAAGHGSTYVDIGAWCGPTVLWAAQFAEHVIAVEPDPVAAGLLLANVGMNVNNVTIWPAAAVDDANGDNGGSVRLRSWRWGNSSSTTVPAERLAEHAGERPIDEVEVPAVDIGDVFGQAGSSECEIALVKVDIEGGEEAIVGRLGEAYAPIILSLHAPWVADVDRVLADARALGDVTYLEHRDDRFPVVLIEP